METFFAVCFLFGALFTVVSLVSGIAGGGLHLGHVPNAGHALHIEHGVHVGHAEGHAGGHDAPHGQSLAESGHSGLPLLNASSLLAFLTWFGAAGFLLLKEGGLPVVLALAGAVVAGIAGSALIAFFLRKLLSGEREMDPRDYQLEGTTARVTVSIPAGGTGEVVFTIAGARRSEAARSLTGTAIPHGTEVVIIEYARGIAAVEPWEEFIARTSPGAAEPSTPAAGSGA